MNERLKELANKAGCKIMDDGEWYIPSAAGLEKVVYTSGVGLEKFAELVVQECADICNKIYFDRYPDAEDWERSEEGDAIKKHFGVEL